MDQQWEAAVEIEAGAPGFEREHKKGRTTVPLKGIHQFLAFANGNLPP